MLVRSESPIKLSSHVNDGYMRTPEKKTKMSKLKNESKVAKQKVVTLKRKLTKVVTLKRKLTDLLQKEGENVDESLDNDLRVIMKEKNEEVEQSFPNGSFQRIFWEEQLKAASLKDGLRCVGTLRWCLNSKLVLPKMRRNLLDLSNSPQNGHCEITT